MDNISDNYRLPFEAQISASILPNFPLSPFFPRPIISSLSPPYLDPSKNVYLAAPLISTQLTNTPTSYFIPRLNFSYPSSILSLSNPLYRTTVVPTSTRTTLSTDCHSLNNVHDPHTSEISPLPQTVTRASKRKKDFSIAALLANESEKVSIQNREATGIDSQPSRAVNSRKRRLDDDDEGSLTPPAKSLKSSLPDPEISHKPLLQSSSSGIATNLSNTTVHSSSNSTFSTDSGIQSGSISNSSTPSSTSSSNTSLTHQLARSGLDRILRLNQLLYQKATAMNIITPDEDGDTHLHLAIASEKSELVKKYIRTLILLKLKLDIKNHLKQTPLHVAVITNQPVIIRDLIAAGANVNVSDRNGDNCIHLACKWGDQHTMTALFESKSPIPDFDALNFNGIAPLHLAAINNNIECIKLLVQNNAQKNIGDGTSGKTALHHAIEGKHYNLIRLLVQFDFDVNIPTFAGVTPLQFASGLQEQEIVSYLIHNGTIATKNIPAIQTQDKSSNEEGTQQNESTSSIIPQVSDSNT
ncbi:B-cell lymphoma 3 protein [Oopsacas minuta]|uniref:B-cell lymphoma 3 protein n=1 Tax=Oopsacas minuta TaxID=111878 RepID=A0AAV7KIR1_9METZ|nr:B-cell lymphoma 3 protein [Oopsacas minuta]